MTLKTLKDMDKLNYGCNNYLLEVQLRQEAIKWIKNCKWLCGKQSTREWRFCCCCQRTMKMNNITEKDLKKAEEIFK